MRASHALAFIFITALLNSIGFGIILPVMPALIMEVTGEPLSQAAVYGGLLLFLYALVQFFSAAVSLAHSYPLVGSRGGGRSPHAEKSALCLSHL